MCTTYLKCRHEDTKDKATDFTEIRVLLIVDLAGLRVYGLTLEALRRSGHSGCWHTTQSSSWTGLSSETEHKVNEKHLSLSLETPKAATQPATRPITHLPW